VYWHPVCSRLFQSSSGISIVSVASSLLQEHLEISLGQIVCFKVR